MVASNRAVSETLRRIDLKRSRAEHTHFHQDCLIFLQTNKKLVCQLRGCVTVVNVLFSFKVLLLSAIVVAVFSVGLKSIELTTDPVELWSAPNSRARQEKDFHDTYFDPFFRTNQVILTAPGRKGHIYDSLLFGPQNFSGLVSKDLIIELLELQKRITVKSSESKLTVDGVCKSLPFDFDTLMTSSMTFSEH